MDTAYDVLVIGAGPAGATCALQLARNGFKVCVLEKVRHPRFHIGESILPRTTPLLKELGLDEQVMKLPHVPKFGAEFGFGDDFQTMSFTFDQGLTGGFPVFNIERSFLDKLLADEARAAGATILEDTAAKSITRLEEGNVEISTGAQTLTARLLMDASGHGTVVGRHLGTRRNLNADVQRVAYFGHFENVERLPGRATGHPGIIMCKEGWFWLIGLTDTKTSVGFVTRPGFAREINVPADRLLEWAIARCPVVRHRMRNARGPMEPHILADFSYTCAPHAGPGYFMIGDAACFLDPIFSTGATLAMVGGIEAAKLATAMLQGDLKPAAAQKSYRKFVCGSTSVFWKLIRNYYRHSFRELFMNGQGPLQVHSAVISVLAGQVFPRPIWALRWRLRFFELCVWAQQYLPIVPRRPVFSLQATEPANVLQQPIPAAV